MIKPKCAACGTSLPPGSIFKSDGALLVGIVIFAFSVSGAYSLGRNWEKQPNPDPASVPVAPVVTRSGARWF